MLCLKKLSPTRLVKTPLYEKIEAAEAQGATSDKLRTLLGKAATKRGIFEGDLDQGELEIGQIASAVREIKPVREIMDALLDEFRQIQEDMHNIRF